MSIRITMSGHREKIVKVLREAADRVEAGATGYIDFEGEGNLPDSEIEFTADDSEFGLEDKLYADIGEE